MTVTCGVTGEAGGRTTPEPVVVRPPAHRRRADWRGRKVIWVLGSMVAPKPSCTVIVLVELKRQLAFWPPNEAAVLASKNSEQLVA